jgi:hypothetical protein
MLPTSDHLITILSAFNYRAFNVRNDRVYKTFGDPTCFNDASSDINTNKDKTAVELGVN